MPSRTFANLIMNFNISDFYRQIHTKENLHAMIKNIIDIYEINTKNTEQPITFVKGRTSKDQSQPKFYKIVKQFKN